MRIRNQQKKKCVLALLEQGFPEAEVAQKCDASISTVYRYRKSLRQRRLGKWGSYVLIFFAFVSAVASVGYIVEKLSKSGPQQTQPYVVVLPPPAPPFVPPEKPPNNEENLQPEICNEITGQISGLHKLGGKFDSLTWQIKNIMPRSP